MALSALGPSRGHAGLGFSFSDVTGAAQAVPGPVGAVASAVRGAESVLSGIQHLFGGSTYGQPQYEGAERSRANSYFLAIAAGSVQAGQLLLGQAQSDSSKYAQQYVSHVGAQAQSNYAATMQQAQAAGVLHDSEDGAQGLQLLVSLGIPYSDQYAGYSTGSGQPPSGQTATLVQQLATMHAGGTGTTIPGTSIQLPTTLHAALPLVIGVGLVGAFLWSTRKHR